MMRRLRGGLQAILTRGFVGIAALLVVQALCTAVFVSDILSSLLGFRRVPVTWQMRELIEIGAAAGLLIGIGLGGWALRLARQERNAAEARLKRASGAFAEVLGQRFAEWGLTPAERDVALFAIKGMSTAQIAELRATSEGTVKAQTNAIYRKAGVTGRSQLLALFIEELMEDQSPMALAALPHTARRVGARADEAA